MCVVTRVAIALRSVFLVCLFQNRGVYMFRIDSDAVIDATMAGGPARYINHSCMVSFPRRKFATFVSLVVDLDLFSNSDNRFYPICVVGERQGVFSVCMSQILAIIIFSTYINGTILVTVPSLPHSIFLQVFSKILFTDILVMLVTTIWENVKLRGTQIPSSSFQLLPGYVFSYVDL